MVHTLSVANRLLIGSLTDQEARGQQQTSHFTRSWPGHLTNFVASHLGRARHETTASPHRQNMCRRHPWERRRMSAEAFGEGWVLVGIAYGR